MHHLRSFDNVLDQYVQLYFSDIHLTLLLVLIDFVITTHQEEELDLDWGSMLSDALEPLQDIDNRRLFLIDAWCHPYVASASHYFPLIHGYLTDPARSGKHTLDGEKYASAALAVLFHLFRQSSVASISESVLLDVLSFLLHRASWSEELIACCLQAKFYCLPYEEDSARLLTARQAVKSYLEKTHAAVEPRSLYRSRMNKPVRIPFATNDILTTT